MSDQYHFKGFDKRKDCFGGSLLGKGHPKQRRPLDSTRPIHLVLRANASVLRKSQVALSIVHGEVQRWSKRCGVTVYRWANAGNHIHLAIRVGRLHQWARFIRGLTGSIARKFQAAGLIAAKGTAATARYKTKAAKAGTTTTHAADASTTGTAAADEATTRATLWQSRPFTRIVRSWRKAFKALLEYIRMNHAGGDWHAQCQRPRLLQRATEAAT